MNLKQVYQPKTESEVQRYLIDRLSQFAIVLRVNGGTLRSGKHFAYSLRTPSKLPEHKGLPDLLVVLPNGSTVFIECKGENEGLTKEQEDFKRLCHSMRILHFVSRPHTVFDDVYIIKSICGNGVNYNVY